MGRLLIIPTLLIALVLTAMYWSGGGREEPADFKYINRGEVTTLDPNHMSWMQDIRVAYALWEGLYGLDPVTLKPVPGAAESVDISPNRLVYTFHLRQGGLWSNGKPVTADAFTFAWRRLLENPDEYTMLFFHIKGAENYQKDFAAYLKDVEASNGGRRSTTLPVPILPDFGKVGVEVLDDMTLRVTLHHRVPFFLELVAFPPFFPLYEPAMRPFEENVEGRITHRAEWTHPPHLVSNGPYRLDKWEFKQRMRLVANEQYWNRRSVKCRIIDQISAGEDPKTAYLMYHTGGVDWLSETGPDIAAELKKAGRQDLHLFTGFGTYFYSLNCQEKFADGQKNPFHDVRVRRAFAMAIDKRPIVETVTRTGEAIAVNYIPPGIFSGYKSPGGVDYNVKEAQKLLAEAGFPDGAGFPQIRLLFNSGAHHDQVAQLVRRQWLDNLGIDVSLEQVEVQIFRTRLQQKQYAVARASWIGDYDDPSTFSDKYLSQSDGNDAGWVNGEYDRICQAAWDEADPAKRFAMLAEAEGILNHDVPIIPLYHYNNNSLFRSNVTGIPLHPRQMVMFQAIQVSRKGGN